MSLVSVLFLACVALASSAPSAKELKWVKSSPGYEYFSGAGFYKFYEQRVTWGEAWETCVNDGTHLITIDSEKEVEVVKELFGRYINNYGRTQNIAVGFHDLYKKDVFASIDGDLLEFQNWNVGEPNNFEGKERCGGAYVSANSAPSAKELKWVKSSPGYEYFSGAGFYKFYEQRVTWGEAWETCVNDGTHLITIDSEKEVEVVKELFGRYINNYGRTQNIAVGFHDLYKKDVFASIDGDLLEFQNWNVGEPNNFEGKERCGGAYVSAKLNDISCDSLNPFICEYKS
uniref:C-type lectin domain-containing protein n=1 Tax=Timema monikensis TaxID=170555 RepID=A0A7R9E3M5_9NEOP|nr:unnamed protein product [Timema monikensis]